MESKRKTQSTILSEKILEGLCKAVRQLHEREVARDGEVIISRDGKVVQAKAKELLN